ncbi:hypothetical protein ACFL2U_00595 [Patescibacteria group bacterium]
MPQKKTKKKTTTKASKRAKAKPKKKAPAKRKVAKKQVRKKIAKKKPVAKKRTVVKRKTTAKRPQRAKKKAVKRVVRKKPAQAKKKPVKKAAAKIVGTKIAVKKADKKSESIYGATMQVNNEDQQKLAQLRQELAAQTQPIQIEEFDFQELSIEEPASVDDSAQDYFEQEYYEHENRFTHNQKMFLLYSSITIVMLFIGSFWVVGIKSSLGLDFVESFDQTRNNSEDYRAELAESIKELRLGYQDVKETIEDQSAVVEDVYEKTRAQIIEQQIKNDIAEKMSQKINELQNEPEQDSDLNININP